MSSNYYKNNFDVNLSRIKLRNRQKEIDLKYYKDFDNDSDIQKISSKNYYITNNDNNRTIQNMNNSYKKGIYNNLIPISKLYTIQNKINRKSFNLFNKQKKELPLNKNTKKSIRNEFSQINNNNFRLNTMNNYNIPKISKYNFTSIDDESLKIDEIHKIKERNKKSKKNIDQFSTLPNFMKDRFYSDIENKLNTRFINKPFHYDFSVKDKIIQVNQIKKFWCGISDYTNPILCTSKVRYISKLIEYKKNIINIKKMKKDAKKIQNKIYHKIKRKRNENISIPKLYTNTNFIEEKMEEIKKKRLILKERKNKTEDNMIYLKGL